MTLRKFLPVLALVITICSCNKSGCQKHYNTATDSIKTQLDTLLGSEGNKIDSLADLGMHKSKDSTDYYYFMLYHGSSMMWKNDIHGLNSLLKKCKRYADSTKPSPELYDLLAKYYVLSGNRAMMNFVFKDAIKNYHLAYTYQEKGTRKLYKTTILTDLSDGYLAMPDYAKGASCLRKVLLISDSLNNIDAKIQATVGLAEIYTGLANYPEADTYFKSAKKLLPYMHGRQSFFYYNTLGNYYFYKGDYKNTLKVFKIINANLNTMTGNDFDRNITWLNLADAYIRNGMIDSAEIYHNKCKDFYVKTNNKTAIYYLGTQKIAILLQRNRLKEVRKLLKKNADSSVISQQICLRYNYLVDYYTRIGDDHNALMCLKKLTHINDSVKNETQKLATAESAFRYQQDSRALKLKLDLSKSQEHYRTSQLLLTASLFVISLLIIAFWAIYRHNKNHRALIIKHAKERILKLQMEELRNRVSPHFIFNVLNYEMYNRQHGNKETDINRLVHLIRIGLEQSDEICVPLYKELDFIDSYVDLQRYGLSTDFEYNLEIDKNVDDATLIPSMIIQTAVENAIKHGLRGLEGHTRLDIIIRNIGNIMQILVADNGRGINSNEAKDESTGTGMTVIRETLNMLNEHNNDQMEYQLSANQNGKGCQVKILIPLKYDYSLGV